MSAETIAAEVAKAVENLRPLNGASLWVHYVNEHKVAVKRLVRIGAEQVNGAALTLGNAQVAA